MADGTITLPPDSTGTKLRTVTNAGVDGGAHQEVVTLADEAGGPALPKLVGAWDYRAGASGTVSVPAGGRVVGIAAHSTAGGSFTINGGNSVPVPANVGVAVVPNAQLVAPTLVFTGTDSWFVEFVT